MKTKIILRKTFLSLLLFIVNSLVLFIFFQIKAEAQTNRLTDDEEAICTIKANSTTYTSEPNELGYFDEVANITAGTIVPVEVFYPKGIEGEEVILSVEDGGNLDNDKIIAVTKLNAQKKIFFNFKVFDAGIHRINLTKGNDTKVVQVWGGKELNQNSLLNTSDDTDSPSGNNKTSGPDCHAGCNRTDPFDPYTGNESRDVKDLEIWGAVGEMPMVWMRYSNSRAGGYKRFFGMGSNWNHSFKFDMIDAGLDAKGHAIIKLHYPEGKTEMFTQNNDTLFIPLPGVGSRLVKHVDTFFLQESNGFRYRFERLHDDAGKAYYRLQSILDSYQNKYNLSYDNLKRLSKVTEPAGRFFTILYGVVNGVGVIKQVSTNDLRSVNYHYKIIADSLKKWVVLDSVYYGDGTAGGYIYSQREAGSSPSLEHAIDPRYIGPDVNIIYTYHPIMHGFINEVKNGVSGEVMTKLTVGINRRTVCFANGNVEVFDMPGEKLGKVTKQTDGLGRVTQNTYQGGNGFFESVTDALGRTTTYNEKTDYDNPLLTTYPDGSTEQWTRDNLDLVLTHTDELGRVIKYTRDSQRRIVRIDYPDKTFETFTYNNFGEVLDLVRKNGGMEHSGYDSRGLRTSFKDALGNVTRYTYDNADRLASVKDALGHTIIYVYNERGLLTRMTNADGTFKTYQYDEFGNRTNLTDELGHSWITKYDEFKRPDTLIDPLNRMTRYDYDLPGGICGCTHDNNKPTRIILPSGKTIAIGYDVQWQKIKETVGAGTPDAATTFYEYDLAGRLVNVVDPKEKEWKTEYDKRDRRTSSTDPLGNKTAYEYDFVGNILNVTRPDKGITENLYDAMNRDTMTTDPKGQVTKMAYDAEGNMAKLTDPKKQVYRFTYDLLNRKTKMIYSDGLFEGYTYDPVSNLHTYATRAGQVRTYVYDNRNREIKSSWTSPYSNDFTPAINRGYDPASRLTIMTSSVSTLTYLYDDANEIKSETQDITGAGGPKIVRYAYNADGLRNSMGHPDGTSLNYDYTGRNQLFSISSGSTSPVVMYNYDLNGNRINKTLENGTHTAYTYDDADRMLSIDHLKGSVSFALFNYGYDNVDRRTFVKRDNGKSDVYSYDPIDQVTGVLYDAVNPDLAPASPASAVNYVYDSSGNRTSVTDNGATTNYTVNNMNQYGVVGESSLTYYRNANLKTFNGWTYSYDAQNRLTKAQKGTSIVSFAYDPLNRCVKRTINSTTTLFYYDDWNLIEERTPADAEIARYVHGAMIDEILIRARATDSIYYQHDVLGNVVKLTNKNGNVVEQYTYDVFGAPTIKNGNGNIIAASAFGNRFMFTGREYIMELGLYDYRNRMYSPSLGRFLQIDPIRFDAGDVNLYRYLLNTPQNDVDPLGLLKLRWGWGVNLGKLLEEYMKIIYKELNKQFGIVRPIFNVLKSEDCCCNGIKLKGSVIQVGIKIKLGEFFDIQGSTEFFKCGDFCTKKPCFNGSITVNASKLAAFYFIGKTGADLIDFFADVKGGGTFRYCTGIGLAGLSVSLSARLFLLSGSVSTTLLGSPDATASQTY